MEEKKPNILLMVFTPTAVAALLFIFVFSNEIYRPHTAFENAKKIEIIPGMGSRKIADALKNQGFIRSKWAFIIYTTLRGVASDLKPGEYEFPDTSTIPHIVRELVKGGKDEIVVTIPEGLTSLDIAGLLEEKKVANYGEIKNLVSAGTAVRFSEKFDFLKDAPKDAGLEGYLFPDTYKIFKKTLAEEIVAKLLENFGRKLSPELREEITAQKKDIFEIVTMASLIENEVVSDEDRALVSGILWKRLSRKIALQVDATIVFAKKTDQPSFEARNGARLTKEDLKLNSPYNTYKYPGLPPGPISNPGLSAIKAAIYPKESLYFYYLSTPEGETIFSKTLEEHNRAKAQYLK